MSRKHVCLYGTFAYLGVKQYFGKQREKCLNISNIWETALYLGVGTILQYKSSLKMYIPTLIIARLLCFRTFCFIECSFFLTLQNYSIACYILLWLEELSYMASIRYTCCLLKVNMLSINVKGILVTWRIGGFSFFNEVAVNLTTRINVYKVWFLKVIDFMKVITSDYLQIRNTVFFSIF